MQADTDTDQCKAILIIEDEPIIRENLALLLELEGYRVHTASNGQEGLKILTILPHPCLILLDLLMPVMNGMEFLNIKNRNDTIASIPVCIVSAVSEKPANLEGSPFVKKPLDFTVVLNFVKQYCGEPSQRSQQTS